MKRVQVLTVEEMQKVIKGLDELAASTEAMGETMADVAANHRGFAEEIRQSLAAHQEREAGG